MSLGNDTVTFLIRTPGSTDRLGVNHPTVTRIVVGGCSLQPLSVNEINTDTDLTIAMWTLFAPASPVVGALTAADAVEVLSPVLNSVPTVFEDFGDPQLWTDLDGVPDHYRIKLRKARG